MSRAQSVPTTLQEAVIRCSDPANCHQFMMDLRWPDGKVLCPRCGSDDVAYLPNARVFKCYQKHERQKFSLKVGTIFEDSPIGLDRMENFWSLLKRGLNGTYVSVEPFHLFRYIDEQIFRYNNRKDMNDSDRFVTVMKQIVGKRLIYQELTGKVDQPETETVPF